jgi:GWxTD domain-containing protein
MTKHRYGRAICAIAGMLAMLAPAAFGAVQFPTDPAEAMRTYENVEPDDWDDGPVEYLFLRSERDIWGDLETDEQRRRFIRWFWERRDEDLRDDRNPFMEDFYTRVADANRRFSGFPRGWKSDRGRIWAVLGRPDNIKQEIATELEIWTYNTFGGILQSVSSMGEMRIAFVRIDTATWTIYGGVGPGAWPPYVLQAIDIVNRELITNPDLEFSK